MLFRLLRGTGMTGLAREFPPRDAYLKTRTIKVLRPWLSVPKAEIENYARQYRLRWIEDNDNRNPVRRRNFLRRVLLPAAATQFPAPSASLSKIAEKCHTAAQLLQELACEDDRAAQTPAGQLSLRYFQTKAPARFNNWLHYRLSVRYVNINEKMINEIAQQIFRRGSAPRRTIDCGPVKINIIGDSFDLILDRAREPINEN